MTSVRNFRVYRFLVASLVLAAAVMRYLWLMARARLPGLRPSREAWQRAHARTGRGIHRLATRLGGAFVKIGQVLGARDDALPPSFLEPLRGLHDRMPPRPFSLLRAYVEKELGKPIDQIFASVDEQALAAASLAQVHRATLKSGEEVVIKIQYPEAARVFPVDFATLKRAARAARWLNRGLDLRPLAEELAGFVLLELDFEREARSTARVRAGFEGTPWLRIPRVHQELSGPRVLVLERLSGEKLTEIDRLRGLGVDLALVAERVASIYVTMIFEHGFFHGDPHPGNLLVGKDASISLLDFGLAKELPPGFADGVAGMIVAAAAGDAARATRAARSIGFALEDAAAADLLAIVRALIGHTDERDLLQLVRGMSLPDVPAHFTLIVRVLVLLNGLSHRLAPGQRLLQSALVRALMSRAAIASSPASSHL